MKKVYSNKQLTKTGRFLPEQLFIKNGKKILFLILSVLVSSYSFAQDVFMVTWPLTANATPTTTGAGAGDVTGNNAVIGSAYTFQTYEADGLRVAEGNANPWWPARKDQNPNANFSGPGTETNMYIEFSVTASNDKDLKVNYINIPFEMKGGTSTLTASWAYSLDGFTTVNLLSAAYVVTTELATTYTNEIIIPKGQTLSVRIIFWRRHTSNIGSTAIKMLLSNVVIRGLDALPVKLSSFSGKLQDNHVVLNWSTASEKNNSYFDVLRSADGKLFDKIGDKQGSGTSDIINNYMYSDRFPYKGNNYYKLKQVDFDGNSQESQVILVKALSEIKEIKVYQEGNRTMVGIYSAVENSGTLTITDVSGRIIDSRKISLTIGNNQFDTDLGIVPNGIYLVKVVSEKEEIIAKYIK